MSFWQRLTGAVILLIVLLYLGDYLFVGFRMAYPRIGSVFGTVQMQRLYAIPLKNGKIEYELMRCKPRLRRRVSTLYFRTRAISRAGTSSGRARSPFLWL
jgi:hypothetical protein